MTDKRKLYAVCFPVQEEQIAAWCWGQGCGKGHIGAIDLGVTVAVMCSESECPYVDKQLDLAVADNSEGVPVYPRKLRELTRRDDGPVTL